MEYVRTYELSEYGRVCEAFAKGISVFWWLARGSTRENVILKHRLIEIHHAPLLNRLGQMEGIAPGEYHLGSQRNMVWEVTRSWTRTVGWIVYVVCEGFRVSLFWLGSDLNPFPSCVFLVDGSFLDMVLDEDGGLASVGTRKMMDLVSAWLFK